MDKYTIKHPYINSKYQEVEIISENLLYAEICDGSGCQVRNLKNADLIHHKCKEIAELIREIEHLNKVS
tara:strand:- start:136 stop:342 length:207 start_codon:yes stop_codon:yes gene_type:complete